MRTLLERGSTTPDAHELPETLEGWSPQPLLDVSLLLAFLGLGVGMLREYADAVSQRLTLRVSAELWDLGLVLAVDALLGIKVGIGYLLLNPDIMADIKVAVPFMPLATVLYAVALVIRLFHGGHAGGTRAHRLALGFFLGAVLLDALSYTFVLEGPSEGLLALHPSPGWTWVREHLRSNASPHGLETAWTSFLVTFPLLIATIAWGVVAGFRGLGGATREGE